MDRESALSEREKEEKARGRLRAGRSHLTTRGQWAQEDAKGTMTFTILTKRAGAAGLIASLVIAVLGVVVGALSAYVSKQGAAARAARESAFLLELRDPALARLERRKEIIQSVFANGPPQRLAPSAFLSEELSPTLNKPKIIIIFDDMGLEKTLVDKVLDLPGPLTLSFLPYATQVGALARRAEEDGNDVMLHLPMEPQGADDPGPNALLSDMTGSAFIRALEWNLDRFDGYVAVNNHMGSRLTTDEAAMMTVLGNLKERGVFFVDSVTTGDTIVERAGRRVAATVFARDVFLDAVEGDRASMIKQLGLVEDIARATGYAVAIAHPRKTTLETIGPWLASAPARGFELAPISALPGLALGDDAQAGALALADPPALRF
ncbi:MAG: divergent polysaccharide deacetylase family protein [Pseudomonadota bacterium]